MPRRGDIFGSIPVGKLGRTNFNLSHQLTGNFKEGLVYPVFCEDSLPGDSWKIKTYNISRLETLISPAMQRTDASLLWFKIPKRLLMRHFKKWYTGGTDGQANLEKPYITIGSILTFFDNEVLSDEFATDQVVKDLTEFLFGAGSLWQMLGLPIPYDYSQTTPKIIPPFEKSGDEWIQVWDGELLDQKIDILPFIAYGALYDEFFRDQTLSEPVFVDDISEFPNLNPARSYHFVSGQFEIDLKSIRVNVFEGGEFDFSDLLSLFILFRRAWQKDYFTSALPTPQRGPEVTLDVFADAQQVPINLSGGDVTIGSTVDKDLQFGFSGAPGIPDASEIITGTSETKWAKLYESDSAKQINSITGVFGNNTTGTADLSGLSPITIAAFRNLFKLQAFLEKNNVAGGRFIEFILAHWAERVPDFTVQRPVFVRATKLPITVSEVVSTASTGSGDMNDLVGDLAGRAKGQGDLGSLHIYTQEPSIILGLYCVTIPPAYASQGIPKKFQRFTRWDEPYAEFQHIGEQAILNKEIFVNWKDEQSVLESEFGYQQRYSEFKYLPDRVVGDFATSLAYWNQARIFTEAPALNQTFIEQDPSQRIFAVNGEKPVIADFWFQITCKRKLSKFSTPKLN